MARLSGKEDKTFAAFRANVDIFISHSKDDTEFADRYWRQLDEAGFKNAWTYENRISFGDEIDVTVRNRIEECAFFILMVSRSSRDSPWVQRELGLALKISRLNGNLRPIIIPISLPDGAEKVDLRPFPCKDYDTCDDLDELYPLDKIRKFDQRTRADSLDFLIDMLTPKLLMAGTDISAGQELDNTGVFHLYESMFPPNERIPTNRLKDLLSTANGDHFPLVRLRRKFGPFNIPRVYRFQRETVMFVLVLGRQAIGFLIFNFNHKTRLFFGSYFGVDRNWRAYDIAQSIITAAKAKISSAKRYNGHLGFVFEVERIDFVAATKLIDKLKSESHRKDNFDTIIDYSKYEYNEDEHIDADVEVVRKFLRIALYSEMGAHLFVGDDNEPLQYIQPCMDLALAPERWPTAESKLWLMFVFPEKKEDTSDVRALWRRVVDFLIVEHMGKTYARYTPHIGANYLKYTERLRDGVFKATRSKGARLVKPSDRHSTLRALAGQWAALRIRIKL